MPDCDVRRVQEESFEFDPVFKDYASKNPIIKQDDEYDEDAILEHHLTPERYNRCVPPCRHPLLHTSPGRWTGAASQA